MLKSTNWKGLRPLGAVPLFAVAALLANAGPAMAGTRNAHDEALAAVSDIDAVIGAINDSSNLMAHDAGPYRDAAQRATNALVGTADPEFDAKTANPGDDAGVIGHLKWLVGHAAAGDRWAPVVQGALVNAQAARAGLDDARSAKELEAYWLSTSDALQSLLVALGRDSETGVLGGLNGALATTALGVPKDAVTVSGCKAPTQAPAYGVVDGYLAYVALPSGTGANRLSVPIGIRDIKATAKYTVLYTAATDRIATLCSGMKKASAIGGAQLVKIAAETGNGNANANGNSNPLPKLYTVAQAKQGQQVFDNKCAGCHGKQLQGKSAPQIAGPKFRSKVHTLGWTAANLRHFVVSSMPASNPGSLSSTQYADVLAYLLASNCYPPGKHKFPTSETAKLKKIKLGDLEGVTPTDQSNGTCPLGQGTQKAAQK